MARKTTLIPAEKRLLVPFNTRGLETLRRGVLGVICSAVAVERRIRAILLVSQYNDFKPVFADLMVIPDSVAADTVTRQRPILTIDVDVKRFRDAVVRALQELGDLGLSKGYRDLLTARLESDSPQYSVSATCALLLFGALLDPLVSQPIMVLATEDEEPLTTEASQMLEV